MKLFTSSKVLSDILKSAYAFVTFSESNWPRFCAPTLTAHDFLIAFRLQISLDTIACHF
jgi:hypothetical protein